MAKFLFSNIFNRISGDQVLESKTEVLKHKTTNEIDVLDKLLSAEKEISDIYERRLQLINKTLFASGDTVDELIEVFDFSLFLLLQNFNNINF